MSCLEIRQKLPEYSLDLLAHDEARDVERHLEWCAGCRKEAGELLEGSASIALGLPVAEPPAALEERIVDRLASPAKRREGPSRRGRARLVLVTVMTAALAVGSLGWAVAMRDQVQDLSKEVSRQQVTLQRVLRLREALQGSGKPFEARLVSTSGAASAGTAIIFSADRGDDFLFVEVAALPGDGAPYTLRLTREPKLETTVGQLVRTNNGTYVLDTRHWFPIDLSKSKSISVLDGSGKTVLTGVVRPYVEPSGTS